MNTLIIIILVLISIAIFVAYRIISVRQAGRETLEKRYQRIQPLYDKLESGEPVLQEDVHDFAKNVLTREATFHLLRDHNLLELFPNEFLTIEKAGESYLVNWLEFPTKLDACPEQIEHVKTVKLDFDDPSDSVQYEVYKYRMHESHSAAKNGWILGVAGPYFDDSQPYDYPDATFSRISSTVDKVSPDEEARWVHDNIANKEP